MSGKGGSSTDKLLRIIRKAGDGNAMPVDDAVSGAKAPAGRRFAGRKPGVAHGQREGSDGPPGGRARAIFKALTTPRMRSRKGITVGVDISPTSLRLLKMSHNGGTLPGLLACREIPFAPKVGPDSPEFPAFLKLQLDEFCQGGKGLEIWSLVSSAKAELFHINIPKVPPSKISETVFWTAQKEKPFSEAEFVMDFEVQGVVEDKGISKRRVLVYLVPRDEAERVRHLFDKAGYTPAGLTISPIALQTIFRKRWVPEAERPCANIFVGRNWSRIDIFAAGNLVLSRGVNTGVNSLVESLVENYNEVLQSKAEAAAKAAQEVAKAAAASAARMHDESVFELDLDLSQGPEGSGFNADGEVMFELELDNPAPEATGGASTGQPGSADPGVSAPQDPAPLSLLDTESAKQLLFGKLLGKPLDEDAPGVEMSAEDVLSLAGSALQRLARQLDRTFHFFSDMQGGMAVEHMCFSGGLFSNRQLLDFLASELDVPADLLDPIASGPEAAAGVSVPSAQADRLALNLVTGLALCDRESTPNLLRTYKDKDREQRIVRQGNMVYALFLMLALMLAGVWFQQTAVATSKQAELDALTVRTAAFSPVVDQATLMGLAADLNRNQRRLKDLAIRYEGLAVLNELTQLVPQDVHLVNMSMELPGAGSAAKDKAAARPQRGGEALEGEAGVLVLDGVVQGSPAMYDALLATFMIKLQGSPLFDTAMIQKREVQYLPSGGEALRFIVHARIVEDLKS